MSQDKLNADAADQALEMALKTSRLMDGGFSRDVRVGLGITALFALLVVGSLVYRGRLNNPLGAKPGDLAAGVTPSPPDLDRGSQPAVEKSPEQDAGIGNTGASSQPPAIGGAKRDQEKSIEPKPLAKKSGLLDDLSSAFAPKVASAKPSPPAPLADSSLIKASNEAPSTPPKTSAVKQTVFVPPNLVSLDDLPSKPADGPKEKTAGAPTPVVDPRETKSPLAPPAPLASDAQTKETPRKLTAPPAPVLPDDSSKPNAAPTLMPKAESKAVDANPSSRGAKPISTNEPIKSNSPTGIDVGASPRRVIPNPDRAPTFERPASTEPPSQPRAADAPAKPPTTLPKVRETDVERGPDGRLVVARATPIRNSQPAGESLVVGESTTGRPIPLARSTQSESANNTGSISKRAESKRATVATSIPFDATKSDGLAPDPGQALASNQPSPYRKISEKDVGPAAIASGRPFTYEPEPAPHDMTNVKVLDAKTAIDRADAIDSNLTEIGADPNPSEVFVPIRSKPLDPSVKRAAAVVNANASPRPKSSVRVVSYEVDSYIVLPGDTLASISKTKYFNEKYAPALERFNRDRIRPGQPPKPGQRLKIPPQSVLDRDMGSAPQTSTSSRPVAATSQAAPSDTQAAEPTADAKAIAKPGAVVTGDRPALKGEPTTFASANRTDNFAPKDSAPRTPRPQETNPPAIPQPPLSSNPPTIPNISANAPGPNKSPSTIPSAPPTIGSRADQLPSREPAGPPPLASNTAADRMPAPIVRSAPKLDGPPPLTANTGTETPTPTPRTIPVTANVPVGPTYVVQKKQTLWAIAKQTTGDSNRWREIYQLNRDNLESEYDVPVGTALKLPADAKLPEK